MKVYWSNVGVLLGFLMYITLGIAILTISPPVEAALNGSWVDANTINVGDDVYFDSRTQGFDDGRVFAKQGDSGTCTDTIENIRENDRGTRNARGDLIIRQRYAGGVQPDCDPSLGSTEVINLDVGPGGQNNSFVYFVWENNQTIITSDQDIIFSFNNSAESFVQSTSDECKDTLEAQPDDNFGQLTMRDPAGLGYIDVPRSYGLEGSSAITPATDSPPCSVSNTITVPIGRVEQSTEDPTDGDIRAADSDSDTSDDDSEPKCEDSFDFPGAWLVCLVLSIVDSSVDSMVNAIADMLSVSRAEINDDGLKEAWSYFRNIASVLLVVIGLVMIIGQAVSKE